MSEGGLDGMMGMIPMVIGAGIVMKISDRALGTGYDAPTKRRKNTTMSKKKKKYDRKNAAKILNPGMSELRSGFGKNMRPDIGAVNMKNPHAKSDMARMGSLSKKKFFPTHAPGGMSYKHLFSHPAG